MNLEDGTQRPASHQEINTTADNIRHILLRFSDSERRDILDGIDLCRDCGRDTTAAHICLCDDEEP